MDITTLVGIVLGFGLILGSLASGAGLGAYIDIPSMMIVGGGSMAALLITYPLEEILKVIAVVKNAFLHKAQTPNEVISMLVDFATKARRDGILALEKEMNSIEDDFLKKGLRLAVDGTDAETIEKILSIESDFMEERHKVGYGILEDAAAYAPAFGMVGTLIGLVAMLLNMNDPSAIGPSMSVALITTFYGALLANLIFIPLAGKLKRRSQMELMLRQIMIEGILAIQLGDNPRMVEEKLISFLPPSDRTQSE